MMASSQVEIAPSSPFSCAAGAVHNPRRRDPCFNQLVIPNDNTNSSSSSSSSRHIDLWVHQPQWQTQTTTTTKTTPINDTNNNNNNNNDNRDKNNDKHKQKHTDDKWARAREIVFDHHHHHHPKPERLVEEEVSNLRGVSSLVQKWRGFEAEAKFSGNRTSNTINSPDNAPPVLMTSTSAGGGGEDDPFGDDWESSSTATTTNVAFSAPAASRGRDSDATERERLRVADIIRKLTDDVVTSSESPPRLRTSADQTTTTTAAAAEQRCCNFSLSSPRIRGRQAYNDLLTQMERDRQNELQGLIGRKPVSKFSHRGRIQALLRFRFLRRGSMMEPLPPPRPQQGRPSNTTLQSHNKPMPSPSLVHLRERVDPCAQNVSDPAAAATSLYQQGKENESNQLITNSVESCLRQDEDFDHRETSPLSRFMSQETNYESSNESLDRTFQNKEEEEETTTLVQINNFTAQETNYDDELRGDCDDHPHKVSEELNNNNNINMYWVSDVSHPEIGWQELHSDYQQQGNNTDWIDEVSRPRSDWEDLRQARYQEMLDPFVDNEEIRALLGRRSVSTFLSSGLRERIDRVMISRSEGKQCDLKSNNHTPQGKDEGLPEQEEEALVSEEDTEQDAQGGGYGDYFDEYEEAESSVGQQYDECDDYADNVTASPAPSWPQNQAHDLCDYSYQAASPCTQQSSSYYSQDNAPNSSYRSQPAIEMELIYDLRGHMEQLHQEMSELRKSIKCCMDMQMKMQRSIKNEVANAVALNHSGCADPKNGGRKPVKRVTSGGRCCICCKMQVDSLLYRCGHMCTCFKCAHELQWSSGKCPICRAPILDVVRTYSNHSSYKPI